VEVRGLLVSAFSQDADMLTSNIKLQTSNF